MKRLKVMMTRREIVPGMLKDSVAVVLDVILATTTLTTIVENGARRVFVADTLEDVERLARDLDPAETLRGGEQEGYRVDGYDLGPLPEEYAPEVVSGKDVLFLTTNGTRALAAAHEADRVLVGCMRNAPAVARYVDSLDAETVYLVCAGSRGNFSYEDYAGAAEIVSHMNLEDYTLADSAILARRFHELHGHDPLGAITTGRVGRMFDYRMPEVCRFTADVGASTTVPELKDEHLHLTEEIGEAKAS
ncbi:Phosphosulfolactate phosphohydrolase-related enzyme [Rubrobacter radiotolerans]|uniref:Probable 2-phosphosulfolactate phosphatase n=1 Tax=Rubrobacter radiotolerans TaxID=42256 RepID=A0A023X120_RUBRA|nr:2-phosphosulfolactate phosphatase [Rubrobacter radiotolerans]AHY45906.1 Phosphosulfolactate phosphohydrolase-related enzyme [Rubrobacter radiotolerans]MDX5893320.1 2-phosphosulfolactate phosphatase [Rubrobacter radiotolerans]SMC03495.1 2-phosphosulfolactate phosphatase [Rubrobacter radiotolerans DSM 5868]